MSVTKGVINPQTKDPDDMFIGWAGTPQIDRRFLIGALPLGLVGAAGISWLSARALGDPGAGEWLTNATHQVTGALISQPYPMIRIADETVPSGVRTVLVVAQGKCAAAVDMEDDNPKPVVASGVLIQRKARQMLEVPPFLDNWLTPAKLEMTAAMTNPEMRSFGQVRLAGTIMDSKCFFGVMRPGRGKTHKACASLCIRGGIPPSFWVRTQDGGESVMLMTDANGGPMPMDILPLVADPVEAVGEVVQVGDLLQFRADPQAYRPI